MSKLFLLTTAVAMLLWGSDVHSQERVIGIEELFELCDNNSHSIEMAGYTLQQAIEEIEVAKSGRLPSVEVSLSASFLGNGYVLTRGFDDITKASMPHFGNNFAIKASQVIYAGGAIDAGIRIAELSRDIAEQGLEKSRQDIRFIMLGYYLELYKLKNIAQIYRKNIEHTTLQLSHTKTRHREGVSLSNDITRFELQLSELEQALDDVESNIGIINYNITRTLGLAESTVIIPDSRLAENMPALYDAAYWQRLATESNSNIRMAQLGLSIQQEKECIIRAERLPKIALVAENHLDGPITIEVPAIDRNFNYWFVGIGVSYDIGSLWKSNSRSRAEHYSTLCAMENVEQAFERSDIEINSAFTDLQQAIERRDTQEQNLRLAEDNCNIMNNRYNNGLALVTEKVDADNIRLAAELQLANSKINIIYCYYNLLRVAGAL